MVTHSADVKGRIWAISEEEFAEKGFAGARVDEIARRADVNKAMIYYYFKSKENLLRSVIDRFIAEVLDLHNSLAEGGVPADCCQRRQAFKTIYEFFRQRKNVSRIILREMASGEAASGEIILMLKPLIDITADLFGRLGFDVRVRAAEVSVHSTFFALLPVLMFVIMEDKVAEFLGIAREEAVACFERTHAIAFESFKDSLPRSCTGA
jgi:AcrR family transcriptional regulator